MDQGLALLTRRVMLRLAGGLVAACGPAPKPAAAQIGGPVVNVADFDADATGSRDSVAAFAAGLDYLARQGGGLLRCSPSVYLFASGALSTGLAVPPNVLIDLGGAEVRVTGARQTDCVFRAEDATDIQISNGRVAGNSRATGENNGAFLNFVLNPGFGQSLSGLSCTTWSSRIFAPIGGYRSSTTIRNAGLRGGGRISVTAHSRAGNRQAGGAGVLSHIIVVDGNKGIIAGLTVEHSVIDARHVEGGVMFMGAVQDSEILDAHIDGAGQVGGRDNTACYAIAVYDSGQKGLRNIRVASPVLTAPRDCGIYIVAGRNIVVEAPDISGQTGSADVTLPKGAVVFNGCLAGEVVGGDFRNNAFDVTVALESNPSGDVVLRNLSTVGSALASVRVRGPDGGRGLRILGGRFNSRVTALQIVNSANYGFHDVQAADATFVGQSSFGATLTPLGEPTNASNFIFERCTFTGGAADFVASGMRGSLTLTNCFFDSLPTTTYGLLIERPGHLVLVGNVVRSQMRGFGIYGVNPTGAAAGVRLERANGSSARLAGP